MSDDSESASTANDRKAFVLHLIELFDSVDEQAHERHVEGAQKYGALKFLGADTLEEALEEVLDLINYARYTAVKVKLLQEFLAHQAAHLDRIDTTGEGFITTEEFISGQFKERT